MNFVKWFRSEPHRDKYEADHPVFLAAREAWDASKKDRTWVGLTDEELRELEKQFAAERVRTPDEEYLIIYPSAYWSWMKAIEAKLKEKNT